MKSIISKKFGQMAHPFFQPKMVWSWCGPKKPHMLTSLHSREVSSETATTTPSWWLPGYWEKLLLMVNLLTKILRQCRNIFLILKPFLWTSWKERVSVKACSSIALKFIKVCTFCTMEAHWIRSRARWILQWYNYFCSERVIRRLRNKHNRLIPKGRSLIKT